VILASVIKLPCSFSTTSL